MMILEIDFFLVRTIHHVKQNTIKSVFLSSPLTFCMFVFSSNSINKKCDNNPSVSLQSTYPCTQLNYTTTNSYIRSMNHLNATLLALLHTD